MTRVKTCIIVGAGLSGLRAASILLRQRGVRVIMLEGRDRLGGRTHTSTSHSWSTPLDLGCAWIHGTKNNPLTPIAESTGASYYELETSALWDQQSWLTTEKTSRLFEFVFGLGDRAVQYSKEHQSEIDPGQSFYDFCITTIDAESTLSAIEKDQAKKLAHFYTNISAAEVTQQSLRNYLLEEELPGDSPMVASTYAPIIEYISRSVVEADCIRYGQKVHKIEQLTDGQTRVWFKDVRSGIEQSLLTDVSIITVPLGVLQSDTITFSPSLPESLSRAIGSIGMGTAEKLYVKFKTAFWTTEKDATGDASLAGRDIYAFLPQQENEHLIEFISLAKFPANTQAVLLCYSAADVAQLVAQKWIQGGKEAVKEFLMPYVRRLPNYDGSDRCLIEDLFSTDWLHDEFSHGSYSYSPVGSIDTARDCDTIARGVPGRNLFFAGEHAVSQESGHEIGTAHGAYSTGEHVANLVITHLARLG